MSLPLLSSDLFALALGFLARFLELGARNGDLGESAFVEYDLRGVFCGASPEHDVAIFVVCVQPEHYFLNINRRRTDGSGVDNGFRIEGRRRNFGRNTSNCDIMKVVVNLLRVQYALGKKALSYG